MADVYTSKKRSAIMSRIRSSGTRPEARLQEILRAAVGGRRRIVHQMKLDDIRVDAYVPSLRAAVFCDGCFYHQCPAHGHVPKSNRGYWKPKLERNVRRDKSYRSALRRAGFRVWSVWEHDLRPARLDGTGRRLRALIARAAAAGRAPGSVAKV